MTPDEIGKVDVGVQLLPMTLAASPWRATLKVWTR